MTSALVFDNYSDHLNKMDNEAYDVEHKGHVELGVVMLPPDPHISVTPTTGCSDACYNLHQQHQLHYKASGDEKPTPESPWHYLKTIFLIGTIMFLAIWILVYAILSQLELL